MDQGENNRGEREVQHDEEEEDNSSPISIQRSPSSESSGETKVLPAPVPGTYLPEVDEDERVTRRDLSLALIKEMPNFPELWDSYHKQYLEWKLLGQKTNLPETGLMLHWNFILHVYQEIGKAINDPKTVTSKNKPNLEEMELFVKLSILNGTIEMPAPPGMPLERKTNKEGEDTGPEAKRRKANQTLEIPGPSYSQPSTSTSTASKDEGPVKFIDFKDRLLYYLLHAYYQATKNEVVLKSIHEFNILTPEIKETMYHGTLRVVVKNAMFSPGGFL